MDDQELIASVLARLDKGKCFSADLNYALEHEHQLVLEDPGIIESLREFIKRAHGIETLIDVEAWGADVALDGLEE